MLHVWGGLQRVVAQAQAGMPVLLDGGQVLLEA
jgi:hypothetical protein